VQLEEEVTPRSPFPQFRATSETVGREPLRFKRASVEPPITPSNRPDLGVGHERQREIVFDASSFRCNAA
jgi:hypothetical protein